jgi:hypothetical protein
MPGCSNKEKAPVPKPIKAKAKNGSAWKQKTCGREPNFFTFDDGRFAAPAARHRQTREHLVSGLVGTGYAICEIAIEVRSQKEGRMASISLF